MFRIRCMWRDNFLTTQWKKKIRRKCAMKRKPKILLLGGGGKLLVHDIHTFFYRKKWVSHYSSTLHISSSFHIATTHQQRYHYIFGLLWRCTHDIFFLYSSTLHISSSVHIAHITCWCVHILIRTSIGLELRTIHSDTPKYQHPINNDIVTSSDAFCFAHIIYSHSIHQLYILAVVFT